MIHTKYHKTGMII